MKTNKINNNQPAFGRVWMNIQNNGRTGLWSECVKLEKQLEKERKFINDARPYYHNEGKKIILDEFDFSIDCKRKDGSINVKAEKDLINRFKKWAQRKGFNKITITNNHDEMPAPRARIKALIKSRNNQRRR